MPALARYMAASVKAADDPAGAVNELVAAMSAGPINDYRNEIMINQTSFFESIGMPRGAAELSAARRLSTPSMGSIRKGARSLIDYTTAQRDAGKVAEADRANAAVLAMGQRQAQDSKTIIEQLVGIDIEKRVLKSLETSQETPAFLERSVADYQANLEEQTTELKSFMGDPAFKRASAIESESILLEYIHRMHRLGERPAQEWLDRQR